MKKEDINAFLDAVDRHKAGDEKAFEGMEITLDSENFIANRAPGLENKKQERKRQND